MVHFLLIINVYNGTNFFLLKKYMLYIIFMGITEIQKFEIVVKHNDGESIRNIAETLKINPKTVQLWIKRYEKNGNVNRKKRETSLRKKINNL